MITFHPTHVSLPIDTCKALLIFAAPTKKPARPEYAGVSITKGRIVATDGHSVVLFNSRAALPCTEGLVGKVIAREYVERELKLAQVDKREVRLNYSSVFSSQDWEFPDVDTMVPPRVRSASSDPLPIVAEYLARLVAVQQACYPKTSKQSGHVLLTGWAGAGKPLRFDCGDVNSFEHATVVIMPSRTT